jgi:addiction module HigA family antidote
MYYQHRCRLAPAPFSNAHGFRVSRKTLSSLLNGHSCVTPVMAIRLSKDFGGSPESWLNHQMQFDLWHARQKATSLEMKDFCHTVSLEKTGSLRR